MFVPGPLAVPPEKIAPPPGAVCVGSGARRYRELLLGRSAEVPEDDSPLHTPHASLHASVATQFGPADLVAPVYVRLPDADRWIA